MRSKAPPGYEQAASSRVRSVARPALLLAARLAFALGMFVAVFLPARKASAFTSLDALTLVGWCDPVGASAPAPAAPFVMVEDEATLIASALAVGITDPRGASMTAPLLDVGLSGDTLAALEDVCVDAKGPSPLLRSGDDRQHPPEAQPLVDVDPAMPAVLPSFFAVRAEAVLVPVAADDVLLPAHPRAVEHPPRLAFPAGFRPHVELSERRGGEGRLDHRAPLVCPVRRAARPSRPSRCPPTLSIPKSPRSVVTTAASPSLRSSRPVPRKREPRFAAIRGPSTQSSCSRRRSGSLVQAPRLTEQEPSLPPFVVPLQRIQIMNKGTAIVGFLLSFLAGMAMMHGIDNKQGGGDITADASSKGSSGPAGAWNDSASPIPVSAKDPVWGARNAPVTIVVFSDFQCPFCSRVEATVDQLKQNYGKDKLRIVWKNEPLPFHDKAKPAAIAAEAVFRAKGSDAFWKFHAAAFKGQKDLSDDSYKKWAAEAGVDAATFEKFKNDPSVAKKVDEDNELAKSVGANGTPHFYINGVELSGAQPYDKFKEVVDAQLAKAQAKIASGTKADQVYVAMSKENKSAAPAKADEAKKDAPPAKKEEDDKTVWKVAVGNSPVKGPDTAPVTVVIFSDYQCPFCKRVEETVKKVEETYKDKVRLVWKDQPLPFHPRAMPAAVLAREAEAQKGKKAFWDAHDKLFASAPKLEDADLEGLAKEMGLDLKKFKEAGEKGKYKAAIEVDQNQADDLNASGTPHFFVNGIRLVGAQPFEKFQSVIDEQIKKAEGIKAKGVAANKVYDEIMKEGKEPPPPETKKVPAPGADAPFKGGKTAKVVIQEFSDFECPFCSRVEPTMKQVAEAYGDKVKIVWRHKPLPMHKNAPLASEASVEILKQKGNEAFWKFHGTLFENQRTPDGLLQPALEKYAEAAGADMGKFKKALEAHTHKALVDADSKVGDDAGISGTPAFVVTPAGKAEGYFVSGAQPFPKFKKVIDRALAEAK